MAPIPLRTAAVLASRDSVHSGAVVLPQEVLDFCRDIYDAYVSCPYCWLRNRGMATATTLYCVCGTADDYAHKSFRAARLGKLECLKYYLPPPDTVIPFLVDVGRSIAREAARIASGWGHLSCLVYLHEVWQVTWDMDIGINLAQGGYIECLQYVHQTGAPWNMFAARAAAKYGHLDCLDYLLQTGCPVGVTVATCAAEAGHTECLRYLRNHGCPWDFESVLLQAATSGCLETLRYAYELEEHWPLGIEAQIVYGGNPECLRYAHTHGCPMHNMSMLTGMAAMWGKLDNLIYLRKLGCPWYIHTIDWAVEMGQKRCALYAFMHGAPVYARWLTINTLITAWLLCVYLVGVQRYISR